MGEMGGNEAQVRLMLEQVGEAAAVNAILKFKAQEIGGQREAAVPPVIKWLVGAIGGLGSAALIGLGIWLVSSVSTMSETLARMDERQKGAYTAQSSRDDDQDRRIGRLEQTLEGGAR
jgi:hypothetical protein